jgi:hypothetical protein
MKKTIIAMLMLSSIAVAQDKPEFNTGIPDNLKGAGGGCIAIPDNVFDGTTASGFVFSD